ncbi:MAG: triose-phosphate isomerase [Alphaproteobacteria bacterium]|nr:triose-phosphate isomerase [Alphaproteobacteria bacterium]
MSNISPIVLGNWKMNGLRAEGDALVRDLLRGLAGHPGPGMVGVCPPATLLTTMSDLLAESDVALGGQDCAVESQGAFTGDVSAPMLRDAGCQFTLVGHSERRHGHGESDALVKAKAEAAFNAGLDVVLCIGETEAQQEAGETVAVLDRQLAGSLPEGASSDNLIVAYEPVWAIGTGKTPTIDDIASTHAHLRGKLKSLVSTGADLPILYGGSVKAANAGDILAIDHVDGALVGGASLKADEFLAIVKAGQSAKAA